jgi:flavin reductase (DIM6/NTAB) family NADH-FMN oxidoreductase RutF
VIETVTPGEHVLFVAEVVYAWAESEAFDDAWKLQARETRPLYHLGANYYAAFEKRIEAP